MLMLLVALAACTSVWARYDFALPVETGQRLFFQISSDSATVSIVYPGNSNNYYGDNPAPAGVMTIPDTVTYRNRNYAVVAIKPRAFSGCTELTSVTTPSAMQGIGSYAFYGCTSLRSLHINEGLTVLSNNALQGCSSLIDVSLPQSLTTIGSNAFADCEALESLVMGDSVTTIGGGVFSNCNHLISIQLSSSLSALTSNTFSGCIRLTDIDIPASVQSIESYAFDGCTRLLTVALHEGLQEIGDYAFYHCSNLYTITVPSSVRLVGSYAFYFCENLYRIHLGYGLTSIGNNCFGYCPMLRIITIKAPNPPALGTLAIDNLDVNRSIYVPCGHIEDYRRHINWRYYSDQLIENCDIVGIDSTITTAQPVVYTAGHCLHIDQAQGMPIAVYDAIGRNIASTTGESHTQIDIDRRGVYVVLVGGSAAKKIIIQ